MRYSVLLVIVLTALFGCNSEDSNKSVLLKFNLKNGKTYEYEMQVNMENEVQGQKMNSNMEFNYLIEVIDDSSGIKTLRNTYQRIKMQMNLPNTNMDIDTDKAQDTLKTMKSPMDMTSPLFYAIKGKSFNMKVDAEGNIIDVSGLNEMQKSIMDEVHLDEQKKQNLGMGFKTMFNEKTLKQSFSQAFNIFPNKPVKVGDQWNKELTIGNGAVKMLTTYKVGSIGEKKVNLEAESTFEMMGSSGIQKGNFEVDISSGLVTSGNYTQNFEGTMKMTSKGSISGKLKN